MRRVIIALLAAVVVLAAEAPADPVAASSRPAREILGYLPYWELGRSDTRIPWATLTEIAYFSVEAGADGRLVRSGPGWRGWRSAAMTRVIRSAHARGVRVTLTVTRFAWNAGGRSRTKALLASSRARTRLARELAREVVARGADGVSLDVEPVPSGSERGFVALVRSVRKELDRVRPGLRLTFAAVGSAHGPTIARALGPAAAEAVVLMGYDFRTAGSARAGSIAPLGGAPFDVGDAIARYRAGGVPAGRILLGVPYYGRAWATSSARPGAKTLRRPSGGPSDWSTAVTYDRARAIAAANGGARWAPVQRAAYTVYERSWSSHPRLGSVTRQLWFDGPKALAAKYRVVVRQRLRGIGIWALGYDGTRPELARLVASTFRRPGVSVSAGAYAVGAKPGTDRRAFEPDGDGRLDRMRIPWAASAPATGIVKITRYGRTIRQYRIAGIGGRVTWDGRNSAGRSVPAGPYRAIVIVRTGDGRRDRVSVPITVLRSR